MTKQSEANYAQQFQKAFKSLCHSRSSWKVWGDFILMSACSISNAVDKAMFEQREEMYMRAIQGYTKDELDVIAQLFALTALALEKNPEQDFLGDIFTVLNLFNKNSGQIFTPYPVAKLIALSLCGNLAEEIEQKGCLRIYDCCCGAGALLIAFANAAREKGVQFQRDVYFIAQDVDFVVAMACYIQMALTGCRGHVIVGNSLIPEPPPRENIWYMPMNAIQNMLEGFCHPN